MTRSSVSVVLFSLARERERTTVAGEQSAPQLDKRISMEQSQEEIGRDGTQRERERDRDKKGENTHTLPRPPLPRKRDKNRRQVWTREMRQTREILGYGKSTLNTTPHQPLLG